MSDCVFRLFILLIYLFILTQVLGLDHPFTAATRAELLRCQGAPRGRYLALFVHFIQLFFRFVCFNTRRVAPMSGRTQEVLSVSAHPGCAGRYPSLFVHLFSPVCLFVYLFSPRGR